MSGGAGGVARAAAGAAAKDQRAVITVLSQNPPAALLVLGPGAEIPEEVHEADELLLLVRGRVVVRTTVETRLDPDGSAFSFRIGRGVAHSLRAGADGAVIVAVMLPAAAAEVQHPDGDPFTSAPWSKARARFVEAVDEVTLWARDRETQVSNTPGHETAERRLVDAAAGLLRAAGRNEAVELVETRSRLAAAERDRGAAWAELRAVERSEHEEIKTLTAERDAALRSWEALRDQLATAEAATEQARRERDAAERDRAALRSRVADIEADVTAWQAATLCDSPEQVKGYAGVLLPADAPDTLAAVRRDFAAEIQRRDERIEELETLVASHGRELSEWYRRLEAVERRLAPKPDALSEACREIAAETGAPSPDPMPPAGDVWEDSEDGERVRVIELRDGTDVEVEVVRASLRPGTAKRNPIGTRRRYRWPMACKWDRVPPEQDARAATRKEVAALCKAARWTNYAGRLRDGVSSETVREWVGIMRRRGRLDAAEQAALDGLERLAAQDASDRGTLPRMPEQTGIVEPPVPHHTAEQMQEAIVKMLREVMRVQAELAGKYSVADAVNAIERGEHLSFLEPPVPHVTAEQERAAIVAWIRALADRHTHLALRGAADAIERCEHLSFIEPPVPHRAGA